MAYNLCRGCLMPSKPKFKSIFSQNEKLAEDIYQLTGIRLLNDKPALLCPKCVLDLKRSILFKNSFLKCNEHFCGIFGVENPEEEEEQLVDMNELNVMAVIKQEQVVSRNDIESYKCPRCDINFRNSLEYIKHLNNFNHSRIENKPKLKRTERETPRKFTKTNEDIRFDNIGHLIQVIVKRRRCQGIRCKSSVLTQCGKCNVGLCAKCFYKFHIK